MKKFRNLFLLIIALITIAACEGDLFGEKVITVEGNTVYNIDYTEQSVTVSFTAEDKWEAGITASGVENPDWASLSQNSGETKGDYSITVNISRNDGKARSAQITIVCQNSEETITINQSAKDDGGTITPGTKRNVKELRFYGNSQDKVARLLCCKKLTKMIMAESKASGYNSIIFRTDSKNRVTKATNGNSNIIVEFTYDTDRVYLKSPDIDESMLAYYYENGKVTKGDGNDDTFKYISDKYLQEYKTQGATLSGNGASQIFDVYYTYTWSNGCFKTLNNYSEGCKDGDFHEYHTFDFSDNVSGISNICLANILIDCDVWSAYRLAGESCDKLLTKMVKNGETTTYSYNYKDGAISEVIINNPTEGQTRIEIIY